MSRVRLWFALALGLLDLVAPKRTCSPSAPCDASCKAERSHKHCKYCKCRACAMCTRSGGMGSKRSRKFANKSNKMKIGGIFTEFPAQQNPTRQNVQKPTKFTIPPSPRPPTHSKTTSSQKHKILTKTPEFLTNTTKMPPSPNTHQNT